MGEVFKLNHCYNMDCLPAMELFPDNYFDLAVVDAGYDENYFKMLTAEHKVTRWKSGRKVERWELKDPAQKRNEAFDVRNYATAALEISNPPGLEIPGEDAQRPAQQRQYRRRRSGGI